MNITAKEKRYDGLLGRIQWRLKYLRSSPVSEVRQNGDIHIMEAIKRNRIDLLKILLKCPHIDLQIINHEEGTPLMKELLCTCPRVQLRMIWQDSLLSREAGRLTKLSLKGLARNAVVQSLINSNIQERELTSLVDRLGKNITRQIKEQLLVKYVERDF